MKKFLVLSTIFAGTLIFSACSSSKIYPVKIDASDSNARFEIRNDQNQIVARGKVPQTVELDAGGTYGFEAVYRVEFFSRKEEKILDESGKVVCINETRSRNSFPLVSIMNPFNLVLGAFGSISAVIDQCTGAAYMLPPNFFVELPTEEHPTPKTFYRFK